MITGILSLIRPLYCVSMESRNPHNMRLFAVEQLRRIDTEMGIRQAGLLAETVLKRIKKSPVDFADDSVEFMIPLIPCG